MRHADHIGRIRAVRIAVGAPTLGGRLKAGDRRRLQVDGGRIAVGIDGGRRRCSRVRAGHVEVCGESHHRFVVSGRCRRGGERGGGSGGSSRLEGASGCGRRFAR